MGESDTDRVECRRKMANDRRIVSAIRTLVNARFFSLGVLGSCISHCSCLLLCMVVRQ